MEAAPSFHLRLRSYLRLRFCLKLVPRGLTEEQPQGLKPTFLQAFAARMNPCPDKHTLARVNRFLLHCNRLARVNGFFLRWSVRV